jgi:hypothetical protein
VKLDALDFADGRGIRKLDLVMQPIGSVIAARLPALIPPPKFGGIARAIRSPCWNSARESPCQSQCCPAVLTERCPLRRGGLVLRYHRSLDFAPSCRFHATVIALPTRLQGILKRLKRLSRGPSSRPTGPWIKPPRCNWRRRQRRACSTRCAPRSVPPVRPDCHCACALDLLRTGLNEIIPRADCALQGYFR